jgi:hypothetical protein
VRQKHGLTSCEKCTPARSRKRTGAGEAEQQSARPMRWRWVTEVQPAPEHVASDVRHKGAPHAACCARCPSAGRPEGGGGEKGPAEREPPRQEAPRRRGHAAGGAGQRARWQSVYASTNSLRKSLFDSRQASTIGKRQYTRILLGRPRTPKYTTSNAMDQMELKEEEEGDDRVPFSWKTHPPSRRWNTFHGGDMK